MPIDGQGFHVELNALDEAAKGILTSVEGQDYFELRGLCGEPEQYGHGDLREALMDFCVRWSRGLDVLTEDAEGIGHTLLQAARAYRAVDEDAADSLKTDPGLRALDD